MSKGNRWIQGARSKMKKKGTVGAFTEWCKRQGYSGVTSACIEKGLKSKSLTIKRRAAFAKAMRSMKRKKK